VTRQKLKPDAYPLISLHKKLVDFRLYRLEKCLDLAEKFDENSEEVNSSINLKVCLGLLVGIIVFISSRIRNLFNCFEKIIFVASKIVEK
jgi:hypothetical protein